MGIDTVYEQDMQTAHIIQPAEEMAAIIQQFDNIVIVAHGSPDGDAIGATGAMGSLVKALGKRFVLYNATGIPDYLEWVPLPGKLVTKPSAIPFKPGLIIVLDCGDAWRMGKELLAVFPEYPSVNIDHHLGNPMFASLGNWVDPGMAATGQMVAAVADAAGVPLTGELAQCVYLSLVSDTGSFTHGNTSAAVFTLAARLVANGLDGSRLSRHDGGNRLLRGRARGSGGLCRTDAPHQGRARRRAHPAGPRQPLQTEPPLIRQR